MFVLFLLDIAENQSRLSVIKNQPDGRILSSQERKWQFVFWQFR